MTKTEKQMIGVMVFSLFAVAILGARISHSIDEAGGMKSLVIEAGKEIKNISREIAKE